MVDYKQNAVIQDLQMKDVLCTREDWIFRGRLYYTMQDYRDNEGQELYISMEGVSLQDPEVIAKKIILPLKNFPFYLLEASNTMIGKIVSNAFEVMAPPGRVTLSWVHELQRTGAVLQNTLFVKRHTVGKCLVEAMKHPLRNFDNFATFWQSTAIAYSLWERAFEMQFD